VVFPARNGASGEPQPARRNLITTTEL
jgi:hypothetical protein